MQSNNIQTVQEFIQTGDIENAVDAAKEVLVETPTNIFCLSVIAQHEFNTGNLDAATKTLKKALKIAPGDMALNKNLGIIYNKVGNFKKSVKCYLRSIENNIDHPEILLDVMLLGISLDKISHKHAARIIEFVFNQSNQLRLAYMNQEELPFISEASNIANHLLRNYKYQNQKKQLDELSLGFADEDKQRLYDFLDIFHGIQAPKYADSLQKPTYHAFPDLKPITFYNPEDYSWVKTIEDNYSEIKSELDALFEEKKAVRPYIDGKISDVEELNALANSYDWSSIHLIKGGKFKKKLLKKCPVTNKVLNQLPLPILSGNAPEAFLSVLKAGAEIKPHYGLSNIKLTVHLGLDIPENCAIRVGNDTQTWSNGKVMIFDDSFEHEAWNRSEVERKVFIIEVWHPDLTDLEKQGIQKVMELQHGLFKKAKKLSLKSIIKKVKKLV